MPDLRDARFAGKRSSGDDPVARLLGWDDVLRRAWMRGTVIAAMCAGADRVELAVDGRRDVALRTPVPAGAVPVAG